MIALKNNSFDRYYFALIALFFNHSHEIIGITCFISKYIKH